MSWWHAAFLVVVLAVVACIYLFNRGNAGDQADEPEADDGVDRARYLSDRSDPRKFWAQAAIGLYMDYDDPGCWTQETAQEHLQNGWSTPDRAALIRLIQRYINGECNLGFDKVRIIYLARAGRGAGWLDEATSWGYAFDAITEIQKHYSSWEQVRVAMDEGRADWYGGTHKVPQSQVELGQRGWNRLTTQYLAQVPFYGAQSA